MSWPEIAIVKRENRHELVLTGKDVSDRIHSKGVHPDLFALAALNYLSISETVLDEIPPHVGRLQNLQTLALHSNRIERTPSELADLKKLRVLDLSRNALKSIDIDFGALPQLATLNISNNLLENTLSIRNAKLASLDLSNNRLSAFPDICHADNANLAEIRLNNNQIESISAQIGTLPALKLLHLNANHIKVVPGEVADCTKLKDVNLKANPLQDRRLLKMVEQCHAKQVLDYIKQNGPRSLVAAAGKKEGKKGKKGRVERRESEDGGGEKEEGEKEVQQRICVKRWSGDDRKIIVKEEVKEVRAHVVACILKEVTLTEETFKKFIQLQTKLHETICEKRNLATIATHDCDKLGSGDLIYTALPPKEIKIQPLNANGVMSGAQLFAKLQEEAEHLRKEKKRNVYTGIHKYLYLLEGKPKYACLLTAAGGVASFPPITNADITKMSDKTREILIEVTSPTSQTAARKVLDVLLKESLPLFGDRMIVQQVKNVDVDGNMKSVYPARHDLVFEEKVTFAVERE